MVMNVMSFVELERDLAAERAACAGAAIPNNVQRQDPRPLWVQLGRSSPTEPLYVEADADKAAK